MREEPMFIPGDKAVCLDSKGTKHLIEGKVYEIKEINRCSCGIIDVFVGIMSTMEGVSLCDCGTKRYTGKKWWYKQRRFTHPETDKSIENFIHNALKGTKILNH